MAYVVVGTGSNSIGEATLRQLQQDNSCVYDVGNQHVDGFMDKYELYVDLRSSYSIAESISTLANKLKLRGHRLEGLVFAAGVNHMGSLSDQSITNFDDTYSINVRAPWLVMRHLMDNASILADEFTGVFLGSNSAFVARTSSSVYCGSKAALVHTIRCLHRELAPRGVALMTLDTGPVFGTNMDLKTRSELVEQRGWDNTEYEEIILRNVPGHRPLFAADVAKHAAYLVQHGWNFGGQSIRLDHGQLQG